MPSVETATQPTKEKADKWRIGDLRLQLQVTSQKQQQKKKEKNDVENVLCAREEDAQSLRNI